jgi:uncharacterized membrane protein YqgA involved in biofilm formation
LGLLIGGRLPARIQESVTTGLGFVTLGLGIQNFLETGNPIIPLLGIGAGVIVGELLDIDGALERFGGWLQKRFGGDTAAGGDAPDDGAMDARTRFITGFVTASLIFCIGPLTVLGSIQDGMTGDYELLAIKSVLDGFASLALASAFGLGVAFSIVTVLGLQGGLAVIGALAGNVMTDPMIAELTATGGLLLIGLSLVLWDIKRPRMANYLPALLIAPLIVAIGTALGIEVYPSL